jgi:formylglycine-generating enzyme required for sulfatase activity
MANVDAPIPFEAYAGAEPYIFVSYAHADGASVFEDLRTLHDRGFRIWYDEGIDPGNEWPDEVAEALLRSSQFLVFLSAAAVESRNVRNEIYMALTQEKPLLAIFIEDVQLNAGLQLQMGAIQALKKFAMPSDRYLKKVTKSLSTIAASTFAPDLAVLPPSLPGREKPITSPIDVLYEEAVREKTLAEIARRSIKKYNEKLDQRISEVTGTDAAEADRLRKLRRFVDSEVLESEKLRGAEVRLQSGEFMIRDRMCDKAISTYQSGRADLESLAAVISEEDLRLQAEAASAAAEVGRTSTTDLFERLGVARPAEFGEGEQAMAAASAEMSKRDHQRALGHLSRASSMFSRARERAPALAAEQAEREATDQSRELEELVQAVQPGRIEGHDEALRDLSAGRIAVRDGDFDGAISCFQGARAGFTRTIARARELIAERSSIESLEQLVVSERTEASQVHDSNELTPSETFKQAEELLEAGRQCLMEMDLPGATTSFEEARRAYARSLEEASVRLQNRQPADEAEREASADIGRLDRRIRNWRIPEPEEVVRARDWFELGVEYRRQEKVTDAVVAFGEARRQIAPVLAIPSRVPAKWKRLDRGPGPGGWARRATDPRSGIVFVLVEPGSLEVEPGRGQSSREVVIRFPFYMAEAPTTLGQWQTYQPDSRSHHTLRDRLLSKDHPATDMSWHQADSFCQRYGYQLPMEEEWEYACRAGGPANPTTSVDSIAWHAGNSEILVNRVKQKQANRWGFFDMLGNIWEWCRNSLDNEDCSQLDEGRGKCRALRGGSISCTVGEFSASMRASLSEDGARGDVGFRCMKQLK